MDATQSPQVVHRARDRPCPEAATWYFELEAATAVVTVLVAILATLVMLYLPRTPLQSSASESQRGDEDAPPRV